MRRQGIAQSLNTVDVIRREEAAGPLDPHVRDGVSVVAQIDALLIYGELSAGLANEEPEAALYVKVRREEWQDNALGEG